MELILDACSIYWWVDGSKDSTSQQYSSGDTPMNNLEDKVFYSITSDDEESDIVIYTYAHKREYAGKEHDVCADRLHIDVVVSNRWLLVEKKKCQLTRIKKFSPHDMMW